MKCPMQKASHPHQNFWNIHVCIRVFLVCSDGSKGVKPAHPCFTNENPPKNPVAFFFSHTRSFFRSAVENGLSLLFSLFWSGLCPMFYLIRTHIHTYIHIQAMKKNSKKKSRLASPIQTNPSLIESRCCPKRKQQGKMEGNGW